MDPNSSDTVAKLEQELTRRKAWVRSLQSQTQVLTCVYCGKEYPPGTPTHGADTLTDHIRVCDKHPMRELEREIERLRQELRAYSGGLPLCRCWIVVDKKGTLACISLTESSVWARLAEEAGESREALEARGYHAVSGVFVPRKL